mgnify:CR=1 FL=1
MKITDIDFKELFRNVEESAWYGGGSSERYITDGKDLLVIRGYTYEPGYEFFSTTHKISLNGEILFGTDSRNVGAYHNEEYTFGKLKSDEEAIDYVKNVFAEKEIIISNDDPTENQEQDDDDEEEEF